MIANYTTSVPVSRTVVEIQQILANGGAQAFMIEYEGKEPSSVSFKIVRNGDQIGFRLPCDWKATAVILYGKTVQLDGPRAFQARRVAWRVVKDWLRAQMALIQIGAATLEQVMLPYAVTPTGQTVYERMRDTDFKQLCLPAPK